MSQLVLDSISIHDGSIVEAYKIFSIDILCLGVLAKTSFNILTPRLIYMKPLMEFSMPNLLLMMSVYMDCDNMRNLLTLSL